MATKDIAEKERRALRRRRQLRQLLGAAVCLLVVIGLFSVASGGVGMLAKMFDNTEEMRGYETRLQTLIALDPVPFDALTDADTGTLLNAVIWATVATADKEAMEHDEVGALYLPTVDIDKTAELLYGPDYKFNYQTFISRDLTYTYVPEKEAYLVPVTSANTDYFPRVMKIQRKGDTKRVTVGYLAMYNDVASFNPNVTADPVKYNDYIFTKNKDNGNYYLTAITASETKVETATSGSASVSLSPEDVLQEVLPAESLSTSESTSASEEAQGDNAAASVATASAE